ncbi:hypothetical protein [Calothrix sp. CCY 0018]|uniref:hypothetical protein n=1 Tax=Calothrix sp. CCY 0018 TaxID=3103864 RepID=UPI0039C705FD
MARHLKITIASIASILALAIAGCSGEEEQQTVEPIPTETAENNQGKTSEQFKNPVVPPKQPTIARAPSTLIQPTNPTERVGIVAKGRTDPFDEIIPPIKFATKKPEDSTASKPPRAVPQLPPLPTSSRGTASTGRPPRVAVRPRRSAVISATAGGRSSNNSNFGGTNRRNPQATGNKPSSNGSRIATNNVPAKIPVLPQQMPGVVPPPELAPVLPPPPEPKLAQAVLVSGVVQVGNRPQAIIKVPSEPTSRYVQAGQRLASGLLVKRIEMNEGSEPIVILEQYGIEVARMVGEAPMGASPDTASTENPVSTLPSLPKSASVGAS